MSRLDHVRGRQQRLTGQRRECAGIADRGALSLPVTAHRNETIIDESELIYDDCRHFQVKTWTACLVRQSTFTVQASVWIVIDYHGCHNYQADC